MKHQFKVEIADDSPGAKPPFFWIKTTKEGTNSIQAFNRVISDLKKNGTKISAKWKVLKINITRLD